VKGFGCISFDVVYGPHFDILKDDVFRMLKQWLSAGLVAGLWCGTPCESFSRARRGRAGGWPGALRDDLHVDGKCDLSSADMMKVRAGNRLARRVAELQQICLRMGIAGGEENPATSWLWKLPSRQRLLGQVGVTSLNIDYCAFGRPFRARTKLCLWHCRPPDALIEAKCKGRGVCSFSGRPHECLQGVAKHEGFRTRRKSAYPQKLATLLASYLVEGFLRNQSSRLWKVMSGYIQRTA
jgi:hypothetical protein